VIGLLILVVAAVALSVVNNAVLYPQTNGNRKKILQP